MTLFKTFPAGVPIPQKVSCPEEAVPVEREGRKAIVRPGRRSSQSQLLRQGWKEMPELDPTLPGDVKAGEVTDPEGYEKAKAEGAITETGTDPASTVGGAEVEIEVVDEDPELDPPTSEEPKPEPEGGQKPQE